MKNNIKLNEKYSSLGSYYVERFDEEFKKALYKLYYEKYANYAKSKDFNDVVFEIYQNEDYIEEDYYLETNRLTTFYFPMEENYKYHIENVRRLLELEYGEECCIISGGKGYVHTNLPLYIYETKDSEDIDIFERCCFIEEEPLTTLWKDSI